MNFHVGFVHLDDVAEYIDAADTFHHFHRPALHRPGVHAQGAAEVSRNALHEFEAAEIALAGVGDDLLQARARADGDVFALDLDAAEVGAPEVDAQPEDAAVADEQVAAAPDEGHRDAAVVREAQAQLQILLVVGLEPKLGRAADAHGGVFVQRLVAPENAFGLQPPAQLGCTR